MKLIGVEMGRVVILFSPEEIRPERGISIKKTIDLIAERYRFLKVPDLSAPIENIERDGYRFNQGEILLDDTEVIINELLVFRDGISITAMRTEYSEAFLDDFLKWSREALFLKSFIDEPKRRFLSQIYIEFEKSAEFFFQNHEKLTRIIKNYISKETEIDLPIHLRRMEFSFDPGEIRGLQPAHHVIERRVNVPYSENRFASEAPLRTAEHIKMMEEIERFIS